jgi:hypothetical protein
MKTVRNLVLAFSFLFLLQNTVFAMSIFDIYRSSGVDQNSSAPAAEKEDSLHSVAVSELQNLSPLLSIQSPSSIRDSIDSFQNSWKLSKEYCFSLPKKEDYRYCKSKLFRQKIEIAERKTILERRKKWNLTADFCHNRTTFKNYEYCENQLREQNTNCHLQKTSGNQIMVLFQNQWVISYV